MINQQQTPVNPNGIQIENTLSMSLQNHKKTRRKAYLVFLAFMGSFSSIFTFLTMFSPVYSPPALMLFMAAAFGFFAWFTMKKKNGSVAVLISLILYCLVFFWQRTRISDGMMYLTNTICQTIYMTDWEYFMPSDGSSELVSVTCLLCFLMFPIICMVCYAVLRYQNFFLSFLVTFPFAEIGLFFGIVPNHALAAVLAAFWFSMIAVQFAGSGISQDGGRTGFLRKKSAFFPVSGMRFMLTESAGIFVFVLMLLLFSGVGFAVRFSNYARPEKIKTLRTNFQNYVAALNWTDVTILEDYGSVQEAPPEENQIDLGQTDEKIYENIPVSSIAFSDIPDSRIYLKYRTGRVYNSRNWSILPDVSYPETAVFEELNYYPPEFLYHTVSGQSIIRVWLSHTTGILSGCIPYGFQKSQNIFCTKDETLTTNTTEYTIMAGRDYETLFLNPDFVSQTSLDMLLQSCETSDVPALFNLMKDHELQTVWTAQSSVIPTSYPGDGIFTSRSAEAGILCGSFYDNLVYEHDTALPSSPSLMAVRSRYADLFENFDARTATPSETIQKLQDIRTRICDDVTYTLAPGKTPPDRDHAAYFLLENHKGYCEHYATAGTILARMAGIPARYCEGYMIDCSQPGTLEKSTIDGKTAYVSEILDSNAHAWTEIYLSGIGWIPFEFTFSYFTSPVKVSETFAAMETAPRRTTAAVTEPVTSAVTETTEPEITARELPVKSLILIAVLITSAVFCLIVLIFRIVRLIVLSHRETLLNQEDRKAAAQYAYHYLTALMQECGVQTRTNTIGELAGNAEFLCSKYVKDYNISAAVQIGAKLRFSPHPATKSEFLYLHRTAEALAGGMYQQAGYLRKFYLKWLRHYL